MARKGAATPSGLVLFDKPAGPVVVRDRARPPARRPGARAGHAGTLDPFATGLLLVLLGSFTKQAQRFVGLSKRYETAVDLSRVTSTGRSGGRDRRGARSSIRRSSSESDSKGTTRRGRPEDSRRVGREDRRRARVQAPPPGRRRGDADAADDRPRARAGRLRGRLSPDWRCASARAATSGPSRRRSAATACSLRRTARRAASTSTMPTPTGSSPADEALAALEA